MRVSHLDGQSMLNGGQLMPKSASNMVHDLTLYSIWTLEFRPDLVERRSVDFWFMVVAPSSLFRTVYYSHYQLPSVNPLLGVSLT